MTSTGRARNGFYQLSRREGKPDVDLMACLRHRLEPGGGELLGDKDPRHYQSCTSENSSPIRSIPLMRSASDKA